MRLRGTNRNFRRVSNKQVPFNPMKLFRNGEQGVHYDPSDFIRYTQPGAELYTGGAITGVPIGGPAFSNYPLGITAVAGKTYSLSINVSGYAGTNTYSIGGTFGTDFAGTTVAKSGDGLWVFTLTALRDTALVIFTRSTNTANFSNISIRELTAIDSCTMFQDSAGATPVTAVEQPVGLMLDKRLGAKPGPELVSNGDFSSGATGWNASPGTQTSQLVGSAWRIASTDGSSAFLSQPTLNAVAGKMYRVSIDIISTTGTGVLVEFGGATSPSLTTVGTKTFYLNCTATVALVVKRGGICDATFDNISVKELPGNHAFQTTAIDRPVLRARKNWLVATNVLATQSVTVRANAHVLSFWGTGTITLSGASTAGPLVGTGVNNRVSLTFTPTSGTLTLTVTGSVLRAQLEDAV